MMARGLPGIVAVLSCGVAVAQPATLEPVNSRTNFFAGREVTFGTVIRGGEAVAGRLAWTLAALGRTLAGGMVDVRHDGGPATLAEIAVVIPEVKEGVVVEAALTVMFVDAAAAPLASHTRPVRIFPIDPFFDRTRWLELLGIVLLDPVGDTERVLAAAGVPFTLVGSEADIVAAEPRIIVVGEGASWLDRPDLPALAVRFAARGVPVLCLAPRDGTLRLPGPGDVEDGGVAERLAFERTGIVATLDRRLDDRDWGTRGRTILTRLAIVAEGDEAVIRVATAAHDPGGWPWLAIDYADPREPATKATLVVCGHGIVVHWDETPAARYFLAAILERLTADRPSTARCGDRPDSHPTLVLPEKT